MSHGVAAQLVDLLVDAADVGHDPSMIAVALLGPACLVEVDPAAIGGEGALGILDGRDVLFLPRQAPRRAVVAHLVARWWLRERGVGLADRARVAEAMADELLSRQSGPLSAVRRAS